MLDNIAPLKITNLNKNFPGHTVLDDINLEIKEKEIFGLIGLNGAGKTTLIKIILDLLKADSGTVEILGIPSTTTKSRELLRYLPEKFQVSSMLKGMEFLKIFSNFNTKKKQTSEKQKEDINKMADLLSLKKEFLTLKVSKYSKGMVQKLGLISTFLGESKLIILDEPMSGLDPKARIHLKNLLLESKKSNKSVFFSSHVLADIDEICDRIGILNKGKIVFIGTPNELKIKHNELLLEKAFLKEIN